MQQLRFFYLFLILTVTQLSVVGQMFFNEGKIILLDGNQFSGRIKQVDNQTIKFLNQNGQLHTYSTNDIASYEVEGVPYIKTTVVLDNIKQAYFLRTLASGLVSTYRFPKSISESCVILKKEGEEAKVIYSKDFKRQLRAFFYEKENPDLLAKVITKDEKFGYKTVKTIANTYNKIVVPNRPIIIHKAFFTYSLGLIGGVASTMVNYTSIPMNGNIEDSRGKIARDFNVPFGIFFSTNPHKTICLNYEILFTNYYGERQINSQTSVAKYDDTFSLFDNEMALSTNVKINFTNKPHKYYFKIGPKYGFERHIEGEIYRKDYDTTFLVTDLSKQYSFGYNLGFGMEKAFENKIIFLEYRFMNHFIQNGSTIMASNVTHLLTTGFALSFKKEY